MKIYIETTIPSFYYDTRKFLEVRSRRMWTRQWWDKPKPNVVLLTGFSVLAELEMIPGAKKAQALRLARQLEVLEDTEEVREIVSFYDSHKLMPAGVFGDATHLALASFYESDYLLTWNCKHLANPDKFDHMVRVNRMLGMGTPKIVTPLQLLGSDESETTA